MKGNQKVITDKLRDDDDAASIENDWKFAAMVSFPMIWLPSNSEKFFIWEYNVNQLLSQLFSKLKIQVDHGLNPEGA